MTLREAEQRVRKKRRPAGAPASALDAAEPIRAGMRARAVADLCEALQLPAVLLDATGRVLHATSSAAARLQGDLVIVAGHLVARSRGGNDAVARAVNDALSDAGDRPGLTGRDSGPTAYKGFPYRDRSPYQLLRGLVVLDCFDERAGERLAALSAALTV